MTRDPNETKDMTIGRGSTRVSSEWAAPGIRRIDVRDRDQVYDLAVEMQTAGVRRLQQITFAEMRAVAMLAVEGAATASQAEAYLRLLARKAPAAEIQERLEALADTAGIKL